MGLSRIETETVINFNDGESIASVSTRQKSVKNRLTKLGFTPHHKQADYEVYLVPKTCIRITRGRKLSEEAKKVLSDRMKGLVSAKKAR